VPWRRSHANEQFPAGRTGGTRQKDAASCPQPATAVGTAAPGQANAASTIDRSASACHGGSGYIAAAGIFRTQPTAEPERPAPRRDQSELALHRFVQTAASINASSAVREAVAGFFSTIDGLSHHILNVYDAGDTAIARIDVEYKRKDGKSVTVPNADILEFEGDLVRNWQIYIDVAPVFA